MGKFKPFDCTFSSDFLKNAHTFQIQKLWLHFLKTEFITVKIKLIFYKTLNQRRAWVKNAN